MNHFIRLGMRMAVRTFVACICLIIPAFTGAQQSSALLANLRCEYLPDPLGIDTPAPRLSWQMKTPQIGQRQTAYQVLVASDPEKLNQNEGDLWDSQRVESPQSTFVPYAGKPLLSRQQCFWKVRMWDKDKQPTEWSEVARWSMGILDEREWRGKWIASDLKLKDYQEKLRALTDFGMEPETEIWEWASRIREMTKDVTEAPAVHLRKEFESTPTIKRATAYVCGLGFHELYINGQRISDHQLAPAATDYQKRVIYVTHDVTSAIKNGQNAIGVLLGNGWYNLIIPHALRFYAADYIAPPRLLMEVDIEYTDGRREVVATGEDWKYTTSGPLTFNCMLGGETYDARREMARWSSPGFDNKEWKAAIPAQKPEGRLVAGLFPPVRVVARTPATSVTKHGNGWRFDLGEESTGWAKLKLRGSAGREISITYPGSGGHTLGRYQTCKYICRGDGEEVFQSRFSYNGYQFVDVVGMDYEPKVYDVEGQRVATDLETVGSFSCSDGRLNKLQEVLLRTVRNYIVHIPNDPTREKSGWTQDVQADFFEMAYNFNVAPTFIKWQRDFQDATHDNGYVPPVAPGRFDGPTINGPWWGGVIIYNAWYVYNFYGDLRVLEEAYPFMQKYLGYLDSIAKDNIVEWGLGDWMEVGSVRPVRTPVPFTSTIAYYWFTTILQKTATLLNKPEDAEKYRAKAALIHDAFNRKFLDSATGRYAKDSQASQLMPLVLGAAPEEKRELILQRLVERIAADNNHLSTGFVSTPMLLTGLTDLGRGDIAWAIATQTDYPSFIDAIINRGNTVMKEDWKGGLVQMPTLQGPIGTWFYHSLAGIRSDPDSPGFRHFILKPETSGTVTWVKSHFDTHHGRIASNWQRSGSDFTWDFTIPPNSTASVHVPAANGMMVSVNGAPAAQANGVKVQRQTKERLELLVESGVFRVEVKE